MNGVRMRLDRPLACLLAALIALSLFTSLKLARVGFDPSLFVVAGDRYSDPHAVPPGLAVLGGSAGYDGQFYYRLALDPLTSQPTAFGITFDNPAYRHQRILYPTIVRLVSFGHDRFVAAAMLATNFVFFGALAWFAGSLAQSMGRHALWGLLIVVDPGLLITYSRDLVEVVEVTFVVGSLWQWRRGRPVGATVLLTLAVLTRETAVLVAVAAAVAYTIDAARGRSAGPIRWHCFALPIAALGVVQCALFVVWGRFPVSDGGSVLGHLPLTGFTDALPPSLLHARGVARIQIVAWAFVVVASLGFAWQLVRTRARSWEVVGFVLYGALMASVGPSVWAEDIAFLRVFTHCYVFGSVLVLASTFDALAAFLALAAAGTWVVEFGRMVRQS